jgi:hypothetical protein
MKIDYICVISSGQFVFTCQAVKQPKLLKTFIERGYLDGERHSQIDRVEFYPVAHRRIIRGNLPFSGVKKDGVWSVVYSASYASYDEYSKSKEALTVEKS